MRCSTIDVGLGGGSLLQMANRNHPQTMSYLLETDDGKTIVIDGGWPAVDDETSRRLFGGVPITSAEADTVHEWIVAHGGRVDLWIITHAHIDHFGALSHILNTVKPLDIEIADLRYDFPPAAWLETVENGGSAPFVTAFLEGVQAAGIPVTKLNRGDVIPCGGITIEVLCDATRYADYSSINDTTAVLRLHFPKRDVLLLGDIGAARARDLLDECPHEKLRCDIVQMAHHGQGGAERAFYEVVQPKICLYTTPAWLWDNNAGGGFNTGPWQTVTTRGWMQELGALASLPHAYGDYLLI